MYLWFNVEYDNESQVLLMWRILKDVSSLYKVNLCKEIVYEYYCIATGKEEVGVVKNYVISAFAPVHYRFKKTKGLFIIQHQHHVL